MKPSPEKYKNISCKIIRIIFLFLIFQAGCKSDNEKGLIPDKTFSQIIYEIHLADGLMLQPEIRKRYYLRDSIANYTDIVAKYGYTTEALNKTLKYYFTVKPKKFIKIYDQAIGRLTEMESLLEKEIDYSQEVMGGLWKGSQIYLLTGTNDTTKLYFDHIFYTSGDYTIQYTLTLYPSDQTHNPRLTAFTCRADSLATGRRELYSGIEYIKDGRPHTYSYYIRISDNLPMLIKGRLLDFENNPSEIGRHARIENISFVLSSAVK